MTAVPKEPLTSEPDEAPVDWSKVKLFALKNVRLNGRLLSKKEAAENFENARARLLGPLAP